MFGRYVLQDQLGAGRDGVRYRAVDPESSATVELRALTGPSAARVKRLRAAVLLQGPTAQRVLALSLDPPPFVVLEWVDAPFLNARTAEEVPWREAVERARALAGGLVEAHRLGLVHGRLGPGTIRGDGPRLLKVDWTGLDMATERTDAAFLAPEQARGGAATPEADVFALGALLSWWAGDVAALVPLIAALQAADPLDRLTAKQASERLAALLRLDAATMADATNPSSGVMATIDSEIGGFSLFEPSRSSAVAGLARERLGRFLLRERLGEGGMGTVYRGEDLADASTVAIKVLRDSWAERPDALRRFSKEARLLAEVNNPYVTNFVEVNEDDGIHYLALEYVAGTNLAQWLRARGRLDERTALAIVADVARGLSVAHERGVIHRDVKPENVLIVGGSDVDAATPPRVKLSDFGLARHVVESESLNLTRDGAIMGTPLYMAPEQCAGTGDLGPPTDVYALGATLYHLLAGRPPFSADSVLGLIGKHQNEPPPPLKSVVASATDGVAQVVAKALSKRPEARYADAGAMLLDLERLLRGEPTAISVHPRLPDCDPKDLMSFDFRWELAASPRQLWPYVSNTERLNRAIGLPAVPFTLEHDDEEGTKRFGRLTTAGMVVSWHEHPFEWVEGRRMGVLRVFRSGPLRWFVSIVELTPRADGGTTLTHGIRVAVHGLLGRAVAALKMGRNGGKSLDQVYRRIDAALTGRLGRDPVLDPFEPPASLPKEGQHRIDAWVSALETRGTDPIVAERLGDFLALAPAQEVARIRPLALARRLGLDPDPVVTACLRGVRDGVLVMLWDVLCPVCRVPSQVIDTLRLLREHGQCEACHTDFELDFANSVELIFRVHPEVRASELGVYCIGGPAHSPHVVAQVRVGPSERIELDLELAEGAYRLRGPQLAFAVDFRVEPTAIARRWDLVLSRPPGPELPRALRPGGQVFAVTNDGDRELVVRIERAAPRDDALTAARASALALFRELFPGEVLAAGALINLATIALVVTGLDHPGSLYEELGDARAFAVIHEQFRRLDACVRRHGGALVKTVNEGIVAVFSDVVAAVQAALEFAPELAESAATRDLRIRIGVHRGPALVATLNDHLDYFGTTVNVALRLPGLAERGEVVVSPAVASDPRVAAILQARGLSAVVVPVDLNGLPEGFIHRLE